MPNFNRVILMGNLTADPEVRYAPSGNPVADMRMAVNRRWRGQDGQDHEETCFVSVAAWGRQAEICQQYLAKGSPLFVEGRLKYDQWERDGQKFSKLSVVAERVQLMGGSRGGAQGGAQAPSQAATRPTSGGAPQAQQPSVVPPVPATNPLANDDEDVPF
jgi:single-strand DNA-binding protein